MKKPIFLSVGELRTDLLSAFVPSDSGQELLVAAPGHLGTFRGLSAIHAAPDQRMGRAEAFAFRQALMMSLARGVDTLPQSEAWTTVLRLWMQALASGHTRCFHYTHSALFTRLISFHDRTLLCPAPFTTASLNESRELNVELMGSEHQRARQWFERHIQQSVDISSELGELLAKSWAGPPITPLELYYKVLSQYFWATIEGLDLKADDNPLLEQLTEFQIEAYQYAKGILRRYGGVFLADVVGLGKTFIALALLRHLQDRYGEHAVVIAPPNVLPTWRMLAAEFRIELQTVSIGKLSDLNNLSDREVLVIDESHNFRNTGTQRYEQIQAWLRPGGEPSRRKVLLLSATPQNNHPDDIKHQLAFFPDNFARLPFRGESLDAWFAQVRYDHASLTELLQHVVVRRTRRFIQSAYPDATLRVRVKGGGYERVPLQFPERRSGPEQCLRYSINTMYSGDLYKLILETLARLSYAPYCLSNYLSDEGLEDYRVAGVRRAGTSIRGLYKVLLLKRLESSIVAFKNTLQRFRTRLDDCMISLKTGRVTVRVHEQRTSVSEDDARDLVALERTVPATLFDTASLREALRQDLAEVQSLLSKVSALEGRSDVKVARLRVYLNQRDPRQHKTIIFTQFADTAEYLGERLGQQYGRTQVVTGGRGNAMATARRFSPLSNRVDIPQSEQIDLLISTDALSEGVNLQDADTLINYDIHWNPVRLIQRAGRIDRIGSDNEIIEISSFLPEKGLESALGLETVLRRRIQEFLQVFGEDSYVLPSDDKLTPEAALSAFTGTAFEQEDDDDLDGLSRHVERLLHLRRESPDVYNHILELRNGRHAISTASQPPIVAARLSWFWQFWFQEAAELRSVDDLRGLDALFSHAEAGEHPAPHQEDRLALGKLVGQARKAFEPLALSFREQRLRPRLSSAEAFIMEHLEKYKRTCVVSRRVLVEELIAWVQGGYAQSQLRRLGRIWKRDRLPPEIVFNETKVIFSRFPAREETIGEPEVIGAVKGLPLKP